MNLVKLCSQEEDADIGAQLLADIKTVFDKSGGDNKLPTIDLLNAWWRLRTTGRGRLKTG
jgi:Protein of unknown function (DUF3631)